MSRRTPLYATHQRLGAKIIEFGGWDMPVSYEGAADEHRAVREACGLFDVSHMGEIEVEGSGAAALCQRLTVNDITRLQIGDGQYTIFCAEDGGVLDDLIIFRTGAERYLLIVNASNTDADLAWVQRHADASVTVTDRSAATALLALQGPASDVALRGLTPLDLDALRPFTCAPTLVAGCAATICRTGYTGEVGVEVLIGADDAEGVWDAVLSAAHARGGKPVGLAARDTLRLEAALPLCGSDMDATSTPLEAGLAWVVKLRKGEFIGRAALQAQQDRGVPRRLVGLQMEGAGIARHGFAVRRDGRSIGVVTSGAKSPTLGEFIALAYVPADAAAVGTALAVDIRGRDVPARVVARPFYRRPQ